jgi:hypothetical protein
MNTFSCQKFTKLLRKIPELKEAVDLSLLRMIPYTGIKAKESALEITDLLQELWLIRLFGQDTYRYLLEVIGSPEAIRKRILSVETCAKSGEELLKEINDRGMYRNHWSIGLLQSKNFQIFDEKKSLNLIRICLDELCNEKGESYTYNYVLYQADELGFGYCPDETAADLAIQSHDHKTEKNQNYHCRVVSRKMKIEPGDTEYTFNISTSIKDESLTAAFVEGDKFLDSQVEFIFLLKPNDNQKIINR